MILERLEKLPVGSFQYKLLAVTGLGWLFDSMDTGLIAFVLPVLAIGKHKRLHGVLMFDEKSFTVQADKPMVLHTDGEHVCNTMEVEYACVPQVLPVIGLRG